MRSIFSKVIQICLFIGLSINSYSQTLDLTNSKIICFEKKDKLVIQSLAILSEEIEKRSNVQLSISKNWPNNNQPVIAVGIENNLSKFPELHRDIISSKPSVN